VRRLSTSREQRVRQLSHEEMGDRKPSQFLRHLKGLAPDVPDDFLRICTGLLLHIQVILAGQTEGSLDSASHLAGRIAMSLPNPPQRASPLRCPTTAELLERVEEFSPKWLHCGRHKPPAAHTPEPTPAEPLTSPTRHIWYQAIRGRSAKIQPCSRQQGNSISRR
jgi:hypothetical protein